VYSDEVWMMIREMKEKGMSVTAIAEQLGIDRKTVRKYMNSDKVPRLYCLSQFETNGEIN